MKSFLSRLFYQSIYTLFYRERFFHRIKQSNVETGSTKGFSELDDVSITRLKNSYNSRNEVPTAHWDDIWSRRHLGIHQKLTGQDNNRIRDLLDNPANSDLHFGFESSAISLRKFPENIPYKMHESAHTYDRLIRLCNAIGVVNLDNYDRYTFKLKVYPDPDMLLDLIDQFLGYRIDFPNPFPHERGVISSRGIISSCAPKAIYEAYRIKEILRNKKNPKVIEIGGGLGRNAFYARRLGINDYTIVDIPITSLAQGNFLMRTIGSDNISLSGERQNDSNKIKLVSPKEFLEGSIEYDLVLNVDSMTEISLEDAKKYIQKIRECTRLFLSINHEENLFTMKQLINSTINSFSKSRFPSWMMKGYAEELYKFSK